MNLCLFSLSSKYKYLLLGFVTCIVFTGAAQESAGICGCITSAEGKAVPYANIVALSLPDSSLLAGCTARQDGCFTLIGVPLGSVLLRVSTDQAEMLTKMLSVTSIDTLQLGQLQLSDAAIALTEVTITATTYPKLKVERGMLVMNVMGTRLSSVGNVSDLLERIPMVVSNGYRSGSYTVLGKGQATIYVDDRKLRDPKEVELIDARNVLSVQVITNPGAKYDANVVINIVTNKKREDGLSLYSSVEGRQATYFTPYGLASANYTKGKLTLMGSYYISDSKYYMEEENDHTTIGDTLWVLQAANASRSENVAQQLTGGFVFYPNKNHTLGAKYELYKTNVRERVLTSSYVMMANNAPYVSSANTGTSSFRYHQDRVQTYYYAQLGAGLQLKFDGDYVSNQENTTATTKEDVNAASAIETNIQSRSFYSIWAGRLLLKAKLSEKHTITAGGNTSVTEGNGGNAFAENPIPNNSYTTNESRYSVFATYELQLDKMGVEVGMRYQLVEGKTTEKSLTRLDKTFTGWLPFVSASYSANEDLSMSLSLSSSMNSPSFDQLNSDIHYANQFTIAVGNPYLRPDYSYSASYMLSYKTVSMQAYYTQTNHYLLQTLSSLPQKEEVMVIGNINSSPIKHLGLSFSFSKQVKIWQPQYTINLDKPFFSLSSTNYNEQTYNNPILSISLENMFTLPKKWQFTLDANFSTGGNSGIGLVYPYGSLNCSVQKEVLDRQLTFRAFFYDILKTSNTTYKFNQNNVTLSKTGGYNDEQIVGLNITWRFNNYRNKYKGQGAAKNEIDRLPSK